MAETTVINYVIRDPIELNLSYIPVIADGGLFIPTPEVFSLGERVLIDLSLPARKEAVRIEGKVVWITPKNALHHVLPGIGIQFSGPNIGDVRNLIESMLDKSVEVGGYTYGITGEMHQQKD